MFHRILWSIGLVIFVTASAAAQDASVVGTVTDESKAVLPAVVNTGFNPLGGTGSNRFRADLSFLPRNTFRQDPVQTFDLRVSKDFALGRGIKLSGIAEVFNIYNYARYSYNLIETSRAFMQRQSSSSDPRSVQLAFRLAF